LRRRSYSVLRCQRVRYPSIHDGYPAHGHEDPRGLLLADLPQDVEDDQNRVRRDDDRPGGKFVVQRCQ